MALKTSSEFNGPQQSESSPAAAAAPSGGGEGKRSRTGSLGSSRSDIASAAVENRGSGMALSSSIVTPFERSYGASLGDVRVHTDGNAQQANANAGSEAFTYGRDIYFGSGAFNPESAHGKHVLGHELAHVAQSRGAESSGAGDVPVGNSGDSYEREANSAFAASQRGKSASLSQGPAAVRFFDQGDGTEAEGGHAYMTESTLQSMGLTEEQAATGRQGNWLRDYSQAVLPLAQNMGVQEPVIEALRFMSIMEFGEAFSADEIGSYDPVEHIDNPAGITGDAVNAQGPITGSVEQPDAQMGPDGYATMGTAEQGIAVADQRYADTEIGDNVMNPEDFAAYQVDETGIPAYIQTSRDWVRAQLTNAAGLGRNDPDAAQQFSGAVHTLQDYYSHSNFPQVAVNILLVEGSVTVVDESGQQVEIDGSTAGALDTHVHARNEDGTEAAANLSHAGREVIATGTFNSTDTLASLVGKLQDRKARGNPFQVRSAEPPAEVLAFLQYLDTYPDQSLPAGRVAATAGAGIRSISDGVRTGMSAAVSAANAANSVATGVSNAVDSAQALVSDTIDSAVAGATAGVNSAIAAASSMASYVGLGGSEEETSAAAGTDASSTAALAAESTETTTGAEAQGAPLDGVVEGVENAVAELEPLCAQIDQYATEVAGCTTSATAMFQMINDFELVQILQRPLLALPRGQDIYNMVLAIEVEIKEQLWAAMAAIYEAKTELILAGLQVAVSALGSASDTEEQLSKGIDSDAERALGGIGHLDESSGIVSNSYTMPTHTEIASDHNDTEVHGVDENLSDAERAALESEEEEHEHEGHEHEGSMLYPISSRLAAEATQAVGDEVALLWDIADARIIELGGGQTSEQAPVTFQEHELEPLNTAIDTWFGHPEDNRPQWEPIVREELGTDRLGPQILEELEETGTSP